MDFSAYDLGPEGRHLRAIVDLVAAACRVTRHVQLNLDGIRQHTKDDRSPVTVADYAAQAVVAQRLAALSEPQSLLMVGEEDASALREGASEAIRSAVTEATRSVWPDASDEQVMDAIDLGNHDASANCYWTLDPIDGTKGFLRGGQYAVSLALIEAGEVRFGVVGCPNLSADFDRAFDNPDPRGSLLYAIQGGGAWSIAADSPEATPTRVSANTSVDIEGMRLCESVEAAHSRQDESARIVDHLGARGAPARLDSQCKYAVVARGQADAYLRLPTRKDYIEKIWDHAAGKLIAEEAGAVVTDVSGRPLDFSHGSLLSNNRGVICAAPGFHGAILGAIETMGLFE